MEYNILNTLETIFDGTITDQLQFIEYCKKYDILNFIDQSIEITIEPHCLSDGKLTTIEF